MLQALATPARVYVVLGNDHFSALPQEWKRCVADAVFGEVQVDVASYCKRVKQPGSVHKSDLVDGLFWCSDAGKRLVQPENWTQDDWKAEADALGVVGPIEAKPVKRVPHDPDMFSWFSVAELMERRK